MDRHAEIEWQRATKSAKVDGMWLLLSECIKWKWREVGDRSDSPRVYTDSMESNVYYFRARVMSRWSTQERGKERDLLVLKLIVVYLSSKRERDLMGQWHDTGKLHQKQWTNWPAFRESEFLLLRLFMGIITFNSVFRIRREGDRQTGTGRTRGGEAGQRIADVIGKTKHREEARWRYRY